MKKTPLLLAVLLLYGCAAHVFDVALSIPKQVGTSVNVTVQDERLDPQVYMTGIAYGSQTHIYILAPKPPLNITLQRFILAGFPNTLFPSTASVNVQRLELKNKVGFGKTDELYCEIESTVQLQDSPQRTVVKTFAKNIQNMSPEIDVAASLILQQCLEAHAKDIANHITNARIGEQT